MQDGNSNHERFKKHLKASEVARWVTAIKLGEMGYDVLVPAQTVADTHEEWKRHADKGDLLISGNGLSEWKRVEVKRLKVNFTGESDWPFGSKFIVCAKHSFDLADKKPWFYVIWSNDWKGVAFVYGKDKDRWYVETRMDGRYDEVEQEYYFCPIKLVAWKKMKDKTWHGKIIA